MNNCRACDYLSMPTDGGHCYLFKDEPFQCLCFKEPRNKTFMETPKPEDDVDAGVGMQSGTYNLHFRLTDDTDTRSHYTLIGME